MAGTFKKLTYTIAAALVAVLCFLIISHGGGARYASAASEYSKIVTAYENRNVWDDLQGATIDGEGIDLNLYNFDEHKNVQIISFIEFCYSPFKAKHEDYGLYVYIYNPRGLDFTKNTLLNKIQFRYTGKISSNYHKYNLQYLNRSNKAGYEGLFYKFKVVLNDMQRAEILNTLNSSARVYEVSGIELYSEGVNATEYKLANEYTYTGYAKGYGSEATTDDTLSCTTNIITVIQPRVYSTDYVFEGTNSEEYTRYKTQDVIHSVYFSVPKEIAQKYEYMYEIHAQWLKAKMAPAIVTSNKAIYDDLIRYVGSQINACLDDLNYGLQWEWLVNGDEKVINYDTGNTHAENAVNPNQPEGSLYWGDDLNILSYLPYLFYREDAKSQVSAEELKQWINEDYANFSSAFMDYSKTRHAVNGVDGGELFREKIPGTNHLRRLFENYDKKVTDAYIRHDDKYPITSVTWGQNFFEWLFGNGHHIVEKYETDVEAIHEVTRSDFKRTIKETCDNLFISELDYDKFKEFYDLNREKNIIYLFRFASSERQTSSLLNFIIEKEDWTSARICKALQGEENKPGYAFQDDCFLNFDIIDISYEKKGAQYTIPVVMSPIDIVPNITPPPETIKGKGGLPWWVWVLVAAAGITLFLCIISKTAREIVWFLIEVVTFPLWLPFWLIHRKRKERKRKQERARQRADKKRQRKERTANVKAKIADKFKRKPKATAKEKPTDKPAQTLEPAQAPPKKSNKPKERIKENAKKGRRKGKTAKDTPRRDN